MSFIFLLFLNICIFPHNQIYSKNDSLAITLPDVLDWCCYTRKQYCLLVRLKYQIVRQLIVYFHHPVIKIQFCLSSLWHRSVVQSAGRKFWLPNIFSRSITLCASILKRIVHIQALVHGVSFRTFFFFVFLFLQIVNFHNSLFVWIRKQIYN